jgi:MscS family membrane protein
LITRLYNSLHQRYLVPLVEKTDTSLDDYLLLLWRKGLNTIFWTIGIIVELNNAGYNITPILAGLGIGGLAFALSVQHTFGNILSGLLIYADGHFKVSDRIQIRRERGDIDGVNVNTESGRQRFAVYKFAHDTTATRWIFLSFRRVT